MSKLNSVNQNSIYNKIYNKQTAYTQQQKSKDKSEETTTIDKHQSGTEKRKHLSNNEINTLHVFFGSEKPEEMQFYGSNKVDTINKGQFLDLKG